MRAIEQFFTAIDAAWKAPAKERIQLCLIGSAALMLQAEYSRGTQDSDVLETAALTGTVGQELIALAGKNSALHKRHRLYLDLVASGLPFLPPTPRWQPVGGAIQSLNHFEILVLDVTDVVVSKLKRFSANDRSDIEAMIERDLVTHAKLLTRFRSAFDAYTMDARATELPQYVANLNQVERDLLLVEETVFAMPSWI